MAMISHGRRGPATIGSSIFGMAFGAVFAVFGLFVGVKSGAPIYFSLIFVAFGGVFAYISYQQYQKLKSEPATIKPGVTQQSAPIPLPSNNYPFDQSTYLINMSHENTGTPSFDIMDSKGNKLLKITHDINEKTLSDLSGKPLGRVIIRPGSIDLYDGSNAPLATITQTIQGTERHGILRDTKGNVMALSTSDLSPYINHVVIGNQDGTKTIAQITKGIALPNQPGGASGVFQNISNNTLGHTLTITDNDFPKLILIEFASCSIIT